MDNASISDAALQNGVPPRTLRYWLQEGEAGNPAYEYFTVEFQKARLCHKQRWMKNLEEAATHTDRTSGVRANETLLSKFWPKEFGNETFIKTFIERKAAGFDLSMIPSEELRILHKTLAVIKASNEGASEQEIRRLAAKVKPKDKDKNKDG
jgi:hypothetical protein